MISALEDDALYNVNMKEKSTRVNKADMNYRKAVKILKNVYSYYDDLLR